MINDDVKKVVQKIYTTSKYVAKRKDAKKNVQHYSYIRLSKHMI